MSDDRPDPSATGDIEARLRDALDARAGAVEPRQTDLAPVQRRADALRARRRRRLAVLGAAAAVIVAGGLVVFLQLGDGDDEEPVATDDPTTTTAPDTTTTAPTTTSTTTTIPIDDDGVQGWPGATSRVFDSPEAAALAFVGDVLGFAEPTLAEGTTEGDEAEYVLHPNPNAAISTRVRLHHTGEVRGWVVTGSTSSQGIIDEVVSLSSIQGAVGISGTATAFEANVSVFLLDLEGNVLAETFTMAGSNGEMGPFEATVGPAPTGTAHFVAIAAGDESGEGRLLWATVATIEP